MDTKVIRDLSYGMYVIGAMDGDRPVGCFVNTVVQITSEGPLVLLSLNKNNYCHDVVLSSRKFSISIVSETTPPLVIGTFGFFSSKEKDKFEGFRTGTLDGLPYVDENTCGVLTCEVVSTTDAATHTVILAKVTDAKKLSGTTPMTYAYYHNVIKGTAPKNAPTYVAEG
jgi:flavin reductase (DIM6/NTAB) family NADH-FMN oxidoreductase RutF